jgi:hypothetical protein
VEISVGKKEPYAFWSSSSFFTASATDPTLAPTDDAIADALLLRKPASDSLIELDELVLCMAPVEELAPNERAPNELAPAEAEGRKSEPKSIGLQFIQCGG